MVGTQREKGGVANTGGRVEIQPSERGARVSSRRGVTSRRGIVLNATKSCRWSKDLGLPGGIGLAVIGNDGDPTLPS